MKIAAKTGGITETQTESRWSGSKQLWWRDGRAGDKLELVLPAAKPRFMFGLDYVKLEPVR